MDTQPKKNTSGRSLWIIFCLCWAAVWFALAVIATDGASQGGTLEGAFIPWTLCFGSLAAILAPVGKE